MAWYYGTYSCGHEGRTNIVGPTKNRQWLSDRHFEKLCPDCWEEQRQKEIAAENARSEALAKEMELPELTGSEKQVAWANSLRQKFIEFFEEFAEDEERLKILKEWLDMSFNKEDILLVLNHYLMTKTKATYFIDNRGFDNLDLKKFFKEGYEAINKSDSEKQEEENEKQRELEIKAESTLKPENSVSTAPVEIVVKDDIIKAYFEKDDNFISLVKDLKYSWKGVWQRKITQFCGKIEDRVAELGNKLLNAGFSVIIYDQIMRAKAVKREYEPECDRWIQRRVEGSYKDWFAIRWYDKSDMYKRARSLPGSKYSKPSVMVKVEHYQEVEEFAELYGFLFSDGAKELIAEFKKAQQAVKTVKPENPQEQAEQTDGLKDILNSSTEIIDDLRD